MNPAFEKHTYGTEGQVTEVMMPGDLRTQGMSPPPGFQHSPPQMTSPNPGSEIGYAHQPQQTYQGDLKQEYDRGFQAQPQPQPQGFQPQPTQYRQAVAIPNLGMSCAPVDCPSCGQRRMTTISYHAGNTTHMWAGVCCLLTGLLCFIPYLMNSLKDVQHRCGYCGVLLATWHKSGVVEAHMHA